METQQLTITQTAYLQDLHAKIKCLIEYEIFPIESHLTELIELDLDRGVLSYDDMENIYDKENRKYRDIYSWYGVSDYLAGYLREVGAVILDNAYGTWWGRCGFGYNLEQDSDLIAVAKRLVGSAE